MTLNNDIHRKKLLQILKDIYTDGSLSPYLGFKGGTAAYLLYGLNRFSVDLDFDLLDIKKADEVFQKITEIIKPYGIIKQGVKKRYTLFWLLSYQEDAHNIKVEINLRSFDSKYELKNYIGIPLLVMRRQDMFAHKLVAMFERLGKSNRDIYDVYFFLKNDWPINREIVELRTEKSFNDFLTECINSLSKFSSRNILSGIGELIDAKQKAWVKKNLLNEVVFLLRTLSAG